MGAAGKADVVVRHLAAPDAAAALAGRLQDRAPAVGEIIIREIGAVVGARVGPGNARCSRALTVTNRR